MYLYRFDEVHRLYEQRKTDPILRAARRDGSEPTFPHHQVAAAHAIAPAGHAVYRICFWKDFAAALRQHNLCEGGWMLQRIRADHPTLSKFERGDDQHCKGAAYIYWATAKINIEKADWSPVGIPHSDIEVLTPSPSNEWIPLDYAPIFCGLNGSWVSYPHAVAKMTFKYKEIFLDNQRPTVVMVSLDGYSSACLRGNKDLGEAIANISESLSRNSSECRWILIIERHSNCFCYEFDIEFDVQKRPLPIFSRLRGGIKDAKPSPQVVDIRMQQNGLVDQIYTRLGIGDRLWRGRAWSYAGIRETE